MHLGRSEDRKYPSKEEGSFEGRKVKKETMKLMFLFDLISHRRNVSKLRIVEIYNIINGGEAF